MTDALVPDGGWSDAPRPPLTVVLSDEQAARLRDEAVRAGELRPLIWRLAVSVALGVLLTLTWSPVVGVLAAAVLVALAAGLFVLRRRAYEGSVVAGTERTTGYDGQGSFVAAGSGLAVVARGSAARVERRAGVAVIRSRTRGTPPVVLLDELLTPADETVLVTAVPAAD